MVSTINPKTRCWFPLTLLVFSSILYFTYYRAYDCQSAATCRYQSTLFRYHFYSSVFPVSSNDVAQKTEDVSYIEALHRYLERACDDSSLRDLSQLPSPPLSRLYTASIELNVSVGETVRIRFRLYDRGGRPRTMGGDLLRAWIWSERVDAGQIALVTDHENGSYTASLDPLLTPGDFKLRVMLEHPREALCALRRLRAAYGDRDVFVGLYRRDKVKEERMCDTDAAALLHPLDTKVCNLTHIVYGAPLYCLAPRNTKLRCEDMAAMKTRRDHHRPEEQLTTMERELFFNENEVKRMLNLTVTIRVTRSSSSPLAHPSRREDAAAWRCGHCTSGFYWGNVWHDVTAAASSTVDLNFIRRHEDCLRDRDLYFWGDSTSRQMFERLVGLLNLRARASPPRSFNLDVANSTDFHISSRSHGPPLRSPTYRELHTELTYLETRISSLWETLPVERLNRSAILLVFGPHSMPRQERFYLKRLRSICDYLRQLRRRAPGVTLVFKNIPTTQCNPTGGKNLLLMGKCFLTLNGYDAQRRNELARRELGTIGGRVHLIDSWQMTAAHPAPDDIHVTTPVLDNFINLFLTYVCEEGRS